MTENRWLDEHFIKCNNCHRELIVYPYTDNKFFKCKYCGTKIKNRVYHLILKKYKYKEQKYY